MPSPRLKPRSPEVSASRGSRRSVTATRQGAHVAGMQRRRLLLALVEIVAEQGLEGASVERICKRAGVSRRTFYEIFEDREACLLAGVQEAAQRIAQSVVPAYEKELDWSARVRAGLTALLELFDAEPGLARLCVIETLRAGPQVQGCRERLLVELIAIVDEGRAESRKGDALPALTAQGVVGGGLSVIYARLAEAGHPQLVELVNPLMEMIVHPYLGSTTARRELDRPASKMSGKTPELTSDPFKGLTIRFTYRTALVLATIAASPGASNRLIADSSGIGDEGQMSRLLARLHRSGLIENRGQGQVRGEPNAWALTERGTAIQEAIGERS
jgi:AcrR family transcriptional regulator